MINYETGLRMALFPLCSFLKIAKCIVETHLVLDLGV